MDEIDNDLMCSSEELEAYIEKVTLYMTITKDLLQSDAANIDIDSFLLYWELKQDVDFPIKSFPVVCQKINNCLEQIHNTVDVLKKLPNDYHNFILQSASEEIVSKIINSGSIFFITAMDKIIEELNTFEFLMADYLELFLNAKFHEIQYHEMKKEFVESFYVSNEKKPTIH